MRLAPTFAALLLFLPTAFARIGETPEQCAARYGKPVKAQGDATAFKKSGLVIVVSFYEGTADSMLFSKIEHDALGKPVELSEVEILRLLSANGGTREWVKLNDNSLNRSWITQDRELSAQYTSAEHVLVIITKGRLDRSNAEKASKETDNLKGF